MRSKTITHSVPNEIGSLKITSHVHYYDTRKQCIENVLGEM